MEWDEVAALLTTAGLANIATASLDGSPHVAVVSPVVEGDVLWFGTNASSAKARNLRENPRLALMWRPQSEMYLRGTADLVADPAEKQRLWGSGLFPFDPSMFWGTPDNPDLIFVRVEPTSVAVVGMGPAGLARRTWVRSR